MSTLTQAEITAYYRTRLAPIKPGPSARIRVPCPLHSGKNQNLSIDLTTGCWFCFSGCGCGGSLFDFEMAFSGVEFATARDNVYNIIGRPLPKRLSRAAAARAAAVRRHAEADRREAEEWRENALGRLRWKRNIYQSAYHRAKNFIITHSMEHPRADFAADVAVFCLDAYERLDAQIDVIKNAAYAELLDHLHRRKGAAA